MGKTSKKIHWVNGKDGIGYRILASGTKSYCVDYYDAAGIRVRSFTDPATGEPLRDENAAVTALAKVVVARASGLELVKSDVLLEDYAYQWLAAQVDARESTRKLWKLNLDRHIVARYGKVEVRKISERHFIDLIRDLKRKKYRNSTIKNILQPLRLICDEAVIERILALNPWVRVPKKERPASDEVQKRILTLAEIDKLLAAARSHGSSLRMAAFLHLLTYTGLRAGEALGLTWRFVDFDKGEIRVRQQLSKHDGAISELKTNASRREIPIARELCAVLREWKLESAHSQEDDFVFATALGKPMSHRNAHRETTRIANAAGINGDVVEKKVGRRIEREIVPHRDEDGKPLRTLDLHSLRHVFASAMIRAYKGDAEAVAKLTGHANVQVLLTVYSHVFDEVRGERQTVAQRAAIIDGAFAFGG